MKLVLSASMVAIAMLSASAPALARVNHTVSHTRAHAWGASSRVPAWGARSRADGAYNYPAFGAYGYAPSRAHGPYAYLGGPGAESYLQKMIETTEKDTY